MLNPQLLDTTEVSSSEKKLLKSLRDNFETLPFAKRWLPDLKVSKYLASLNSLVKRNIIKSYPPLYDIPNSYVSQFEHTIFISEKGTEVLSRGDDY